MNDADREVEDESAEEYPHLETFPHKASRLRETTDPLAALLKGHTLYEAVLRELLAKLVQRPEALTFARLSFGQLVEVGIALGAVPEQRRPFLKKLNSLRNKVAHRYDFEVTHKEVAELRSTVVLPETSKWPEYEAEPSAASRLTKMIELECWILYLVAKEHYEGQQLVKKALDIIKKRRSSSE